jgi:hypothetical protein
MADACLRPKENGGGWSHRSQNRLLLTELVPDRQQTQDLAAMKDFLLNRGVFAARQLRVYIRSIYNRVVTDILVRIQLG